MNTKNEDGATSLHAAAANGHEEIAEVLLANRADVNAKSDYLLTPLHLAAAVGHKGIVEVLLANKADVNARDKDGRTSLFFAALKGYKDVVEVLLANKADANVADKDGRTPLFAAATEGYKEVVEVLLASKADVTIKDKDGLTPLSAAGVNGHKEVMEVLLTNAVAVREAAELPQPAEDVAKRGRDAENASKGQKAMEESVQSQPQSMPPQDTVLQVFSGSGGRNTRPFTVKDGWEIQWDASGDVFQLFLNRADGETLGVAANQQGSGRGASYQAKGGQYYLQVNSVGNWTIKIVQIKN